MSLDLDRLHGLTLFTLTGTHAYGCGGTEDADTDPQGHETFLLPDQATFERVEPDVRPVWDQLWPDPSRLATMSAERLEEHLAVAREAGVSLQLHRRPSPAPVFGPDWSGTLGQLWTAQDGVTHLVGRWAKHTAVQFQHARVQLLTARGAVGLNAWLPGGRHWVHDFGCRCLCGVSDYGDGGITLHSHEGKVFAADPDTVDVEGRIAETAEAAAAARAKAQGELDSLPSLVELDQLVRAVPDRYRDQDAVDLTWPQWVDRLQRRREAAAQALQARDVARLAELGVRTGAVEPDEAFRGAYTRELSRAGLYVLDADAVSELLSVLPVVRP